MQNSQPDLHFAQCLVASESHPLQICNSVLLPVSYHMLPFLFVLCLVTIMYRVRTVAAPSNPNVELPTVLATCTFESF
jgi:hypothetical protein